MNPLTEKLRPHAKDIERAAAHGDKQAQQVMRLYRMYRGCPDDPGAPALCEAAFDDWMKGRKP